MNTKKIFYVGVAVIIIAAVVLFLLWWKKVERENLILANPPIEKPLLLKRATGGLAQEQQQNINEYKNKILTRASLKVPLTAAEKINFEIILLKGSNSSGEYMFADQSVLKFTAEELRLISDAIKYK